MFSTKLFSGKQLLSAMAGLAMLALPVNALAERHDDGRDHARPHDHGFYREWRDHSRDRHLGDHPQWTPRPGWYGVPAQRPPAIYGWNNGHRACDGDGDRCGWVANRPAPIYQPLPPPNYRYNPGYRYGEQDDYEAGAYPSYLQEPPAGYNQSQQLSWLMAKRQRTMVTIAQLRARHDSRGAARLVPVVTALNQRIAALNNRLGYNGGYSYAPAASYSAPGYAAPYNGAYAGSPLYGNPSIGVLSALALPLLGVR